MTLWNDLRMALRLLAKRPAFALAAAVTLALGIGANAAIFSVVHAVLMEPLPFPQPDRLVLLWQTTPGFDPHESSPLNFRDWRERAHSFSGMSVIAGRSANLTGDGDPERLRAVGVNAGYFAVLGLSPALGRGFRPEEDRVGGAPVAVLSDGLWRRRFAADPAIVGREVLLDGAPVTVVGVADPEVTFPRDTDLWVPAALDFDNITRDTVYLAVVARLRPEVGRDRAQTEMAGIAAALRAEYPRENLDQGIAVESLDEHLVKDVRPALLVLLAAVGLVLLVACANVTNLFLARLASREKEVAMRLTLGADRRRLVRQLLAESLLLAALGAGLGLAVASWGVKLLVALGGSELPRADRIGLDPVVLGFTAVVTVLTAVVVGLVPAWRAAAGPLEGTLRREGRGVAAGGSTLRRGLVVAETAFALVLAVGAGLLLQSFSRLLSVDPGFAPAGLTIARVSLPGSRYPDSPQQAAFFDRALEQVRALPGVETATAGFPLPLSGAAFVLDFRVEGQPLVSGVAPPSADVRFVGSRYFATLEIPLLAGRGIEERDTATAPPVVVVNRAFARRYLSGEAEAVGRRISLGTTPGTEPQWVTVAGVVGDVRHLELADAGSPEMYWPYRQQTRGSMYLLVRGGGERQALVAALRRTVRGLDPDLPLYSVTSGEELIAGALERPRFLTVLLALFAGLAVLLALLGVYSVLSYTVNQRRREMGVRLALGSSRKRLLRRVLGQGLAPAGLGVALGLAAAFALARLLSSLVYGVSVSDPATYAGTGTLIAMVAGFASLGPAWRATRVDPAVTLRIEE